MNISAKPLFLVLFLLNAVSLFSQKLPIGYIEQYNQKVNSPAFFENFLPQYSDKWLLAGEKDSKTVSILPSDSSISSLAVPSNGGILNYLVFGDYWIDFEYKFASSSIDSNALYFLGSVKSSNLFYAFRIASDSIYFYFCNGEKQVEIDRKLITNLKPGWNKLHIERDILARTNSFVWNGDETSRIVFHNKSLVMGFIGFGTGGYNSFIRNIKVWAPTSIADSSFKWTPKP